MGFTLPQVATCLRQYLAIIIKSQRKHQSNFEKTTTKHFGGQKVKNIQFFYNTLKFDQRI